MCCQLDFEDEPEDEGDEAEASSEDKESGSEDETFEDAMENLNLNEAPQTVTVAG